MEYRNVRKTKRVIRKTFVELLEEKGSIDKITVKELTERADISKSTFYAHYQDIYSVLEEFNADIISTISNSIDEYFQDSERDFKPYLEKLLTMFKENEGLYKKLFLQSESIYFVDKVKLMIKDELSKYLLQKKIIINPKKFEFCVLILTNGITYLVVDYFKNNTTLSLDDIAEEVSGFLEIQRKIINDKDILSELNLQ